MSTLDKINPKTRAAVEKVINPLLEARRTPKRKTVAPKVKVWVVELKKRKRISGRWGDEYTTETHYVTAEAFNTRTKVYKTPSMGMHLTPEKLAEIQRQMETGEGLKFDYQIVDRKGKAHTFTESQVRNAKVVEDPATVVKVAEAVRRNDSITFTLFGRPCIYYFKERRLRIGCQNKTLSEWTGDEGKRTITYQIGPLVPMERKHSCNCQHCTHTGEVESTEPASRVAIQAFHGLKVFRELITAFDAEEKATKVPVVSAEDTPKPELDMSGLPPVPEKKEKPKVPKTRNYW